MIKSQKAQKAKEQPPKGFKGLPFIIILLISYLNHLIYSFFSENKLCLHRFGRSTPVEEQRMAYIQLIDQRGYKKSTQAKWEEYSLNLFSKTSRLHRTVKNISVEERRMNFIRISLLNGKRGKSNKRENNPRRIRFPLSLFIVSDSSTEKSSSYNREGAHQEENWYQSEYYGKQKSN